MSQPLNNQSGRLLLAMSRRFVCARLRRCCADLQPSDIDDIAQSVVVDTLTALSAGGLTADRIRNVVWTSCRRRVIEHFEQAGRLGMTDVPDRRESRTIAEHPDALQTVVDRPDNQPAHLSEVVANLLPVECLSVADALVAGETTRRAAAIADVSERTVRRRKHAIAAALLVESALVTV